MGLYPNIDMKRTGNRIESAIRNAGYDVKTIQSYLQLSCPQPIYRWFKGQILPSVDHLFMLSMLLGMHMEELLVEKQREIFCFIKEAVREKDWKRYQLYYEKLFGLTVQ